VWLRVGVGEGVLRYSGGGSAAAVAGSGNGV
jgi:hypothetical protein